MSLDPYIQSILIRSQIAEAHREAAQRQLIRQAKRSTPRPRRWPASSALSWALSILRLKRRVERVVLP